MDENGPGLAGYVVAIVLVAVVVVLALVLLSPWLAHLLAGLG